jgi:diguanylate cyclase (GGDEF)-like protein
VRLHFGQRTKGFFDWAIAAAFVAAYAVAFATGSGLRARGIAFNAAMLLLASRGIAYLTGLKGAERRMARGLRWVLAGFCLASAARIALSLALPELEDLFSGPSYDSYALMLILSLFLALTFSLVSMLARRINLEQADLMAERERASSILRIRLELREYAAGHTTEELMVKALDEIEAVTGSSIGFYHFVDEDRGLLSLQAWSTRTTSEFCRADAKGMEYSIAEAGVWADCVRSRAPTVHNDYPSTPGRKGLPSGHAELRRELVAPTLRAGKVVAILGVGNKESEYNREDVALVSYMVDLVWTIVAQKRSDERILQLNAQLERLAMTDELTGLSNRRAFFAAAERELGKARRYSQSLSFVMLDIDRFKSVNDEHGHDSGDAVLRMVADTVRSRVRGVDLPARLGGEEFGVLMPSTRLEEALLSAERLRAAIAEASCSLRGIELRVTISAGVSAYGEDAPDLDAIMRAADQAMYRAKAAGRDRVESA